MDSNKQIIKNNEPVKLYFYFNIQQFLPNLENDPEEDKGTRYHLYAVIVHEGPSSYAGHYYVYARDLDK